MSFGLRANTPCMHTNRPRCTPSRPSKITALRSPGRSYSRHHRPTVAPAGLSLAADQGSFASSRYHEKTTKLVALVNELTDAGVASTLDLPQIVVCGNQSSGKSSLMERLCGVSLPRASGTCTRCPTEIRMCQKRSQAEPWACTMKLRHSQDDATGQPAEDIRHTVFAELEGDAGKQSLARYISAAQAALLNPGKEWQGFASSAHEQASAAPQSSNDELPFTRNVVVLEITGAEVDLTLIDLPGIIQSSVNMDESNIGLIRSMVHDYIKSERTIIVEAITMKDDLENQAIVNMAKEVDPQGSRTIAVLTKPDTIEEGTHGTWLSILRNERCKLDLGYYVVRNPSQAELDASCTACTATRQAEAAKLETAFFASTAPWNSGALAGRHARLGVGNVRNALSQQLVSLTQQELPIIKAQVAEKARQVADQLAALPERLEGDAATQLHVLSRKFSTALEAAEANHDDGDFCQKVQVSFSAFAAALVKAQPLFGSWDDDEQQCISTFADASQMAVPDFTFQDVFALVNLHRTYHELPGVVSAKVLASLIQQHKGDWGELSTECLAAVSARLEEEFSALAKTIYGSHPGAHGAVMDLLHELFEEASATTKHRLKEVLDMEDLTFTQNSHYFTGSKQAFQKVIDMLVQDDDDTEIENDYYVVELVAAMFAYLKVATKRITDTVPLHIRYHLLQSFVQRVDDHLMVRLMQGSSADGQSLEDLMQEEPGLAQARQQLQALDKQLKKAQRILSSL